MVSVSLSSSDDEDCVGDSDCACVFGVVLVLVLVREDARFTSPPRTLRAPRKTPLTDSVIVGFLGGGCWEVVMVVWW